MIEFNENPFMKDTPVKPFSNGSEACCWKESNCEKCTNYESESDSEDSAKCKLAYHLDYGFAIGTIPLWVAKEIGCSYIPLYGFVDLNEKCRNFTDGSNPFL